MAMLAEQVSSVDGRSPCATRIALDGIRRERSRHGVGNSCALVFRKPVPSTHQRDHISGISMHGAEILTVLAIEVLGPQGTVLGISQFTQKAVGLRREQIAPAVFS